jgi:hypothetical protein
MTNVWKESVPDDTGPKKGEVVHVHEQFRILRNKKMFSASVQWQEDFYCMH